MYPLSASTAFLTLTMAPGNLTQLEELLGEKGIDVQDILIPVAAVKITDKTSKTTAMDIKMMPIPERGWLEEFRGWGVAPLVLKVGQDPRPSSEELRKELFSFLRKARSPCFVTSLFTYYASEAVQWPESDKRALKPEELWPEWRNALEQESEETPGRTLPKVITGSKYGPTGGFDTACLSPSIKGAYANELVKVANHALSANTWKSYSTIWNNIAKISKETRVEITYPMNLEMVQAILGFYIVKGLKASTIRGYIASLKKGHAIKGCKSEALDDGFVETILNGLKNKESVQKQEPKGVMTLEILELIWKKLKTSSLHISEKRLLWAASSLLFFGSLRPSECLCAKPHEFDKAKTLTWADVKFIETKIDGKTVDFLQLKLKNPKTTSSLPDQVVEIPALDTKICAVKAMRKWHLVSKGELHKDHPVFMKRSGELATMGYFNAVLRDLLGEISPKITARSFRPGLSTILARQGASQESLKSLGRWTSKAYLCYIKKGRANNWRNSYFQLQEAIKNN